jgi:hypothetical protein
VFSQDWCVAISIGLLFYVLADLVSHRTWHIAVLVVALVAFTAAVVLSVTVIPAP